MEEAIKGEFSFDWSKLIRNLASPAKPGDKSYDELVKLLMEHYKPSLSKTVNSISQGNRWQTLWQRDGFWLSFATRNIPGDCVA